MRRLLLAVAVVGLPAAAPAGEVEDLRDRVLRAVADNPADLKKLRTYTLKGTGKNKVGAVAIPAVMELTASWPGKMMARWENGEGAGKNISVQCVTDDRGWQQGSTIPLADMSIAAVNDFRADAYARWVAMLGTLNDPGQQLKLAPPMKVGGEPAVGLIVIRKPMPEVMLHFDAKTLLLRRSAYSAREAGVATTREFLWDGHKVVDGLKMPTKERVVIQGKEMFEWTTLEFKFPEAIDAKVFAKP
ncbi:MAG TPA: hypothetical protein VM597_05285 [Gemmataceae bacterium]|jgi:hypothetical protein|nr:hypothetical protein [Gemmataceae bacterium]